MVPFIFSSSALCAVCLPCCGEQCPHICQKTALDFVPIDPKGHPSPFLSICFSWTQQYQNDSSVGSGSGITWYIYMMFMRREHDILLDFESLSTPVGYGDPDSTKKCLEACKRMAYTNSLLSCRLCTCSTDRSVMQKEPSLKISCAETCRCSKKRQKCSYCVFAWAMYPFNAKIQLKRVSGSRKDFHTIYSQVIWQLKILFSSVTNYFLEQGSCLSLNAVHISHQ